MELGPSTLADALPNQPHRLPDGSIITFSDALVHGRVVDVQKGEARVHTGDDTYRSTDFDDPKADERTVNVSIKVDETLAGDVPHSTLVFGMGLMGAPDADTYIAGLRSLGDVVVAVKSITDGPDTGAYYPVLSGALIGRVDGSGEVTFAGIPDDEQTAFLQGIHTLDALRAAAAEEREPSLFPPLPSGKGTDVPAPDKSA